MEPVSNAADSEATVNCLIGAVRSGAPARERRSTAETLSSAKVVLRSDSSATLRTLSLVFGFVRQDGSASTNRALLAMLAAGQRLR